MCAVVKLGERFAQVGGRKSGEGTSTVPPTTVPKPAEAATTRPKEVVEVEDGPEPVVVGKNNKRKEKPEDVPEKSRKKIRTKTLAKKREDEDVTDIHILSDNEPRVCTLHAGTTLIVKEWERRMEDMELEAKTPLPQV